MTWWQFLIAIYLFVALFLWCAYISGRVKRPFWYAAWDAVTSAVGALLWIVWVVIDAFTQFQRRTVARPDRGTDDEQDGRTEGEQTLPYGPDSSEDSVETW